MIEKHISEESEESECARKTFSLLKSKRKTYKKVFLNILTTKALKITTYYNFYYTTIFSNSKLTLNY